VDKPKRPRRGRAVPNEPRLTSPLPFDAPHHGGAGGGAGGGVDTETDCPGPDDLNHHHHHHPDARGLAKHVKAFWGWNNAQDTIEEHGHDLILGVLDTLIEQYGDLLDAPLKSTPTIQTGLGTKRGPPEIKNPAGFILYHVRRTAEQASRTSRQIPRHLRDVSSGAAN